MASIINRKFNTFSRDGDIALVGISGRDSYGRIIPGSEHFMPLNSAVNEPTADFTDQLALQFTPAGAMYVNGGLMKTRLAPDMGPVKNVWVEWTLTDSAVVGAQTAQIITVTSYTTVAGTAAVLTAGDISYGLPDFHLWTKPLPWTSTPATVAAAISALDPNIIHTVAGGGAALSAGAMTLTFDIRDRDIKLGLNCYGCSIGGGVVAVVDPAISTPFVLGGALHMVPTPLQVDYVALKVNGDVKSRITGGKLWQSILFHHNEHKLDNIMRRCGFNLDLDEPTILIPAAGATTVTLHLPLQQFIGSLRQMFPVRFPKSVFEVELKFKTDNSILMSNTVSGSATATTGTLANLVLGNMSVWATYSRLSASDAKDLQAVSLTRQITIRHVWQNTGACHGTTGLVVAGATYQAAVGQTADVVAAQFSLEPNVAANGDYFVHPLPLASITLNDSSNRSILGFTSISDAQMQDEIIPYAYGSQDARVNEFFHLYAWIPCDKLDDAIDKGAVHGYYALQGNETFSYVAGVVPAAAAAVSFAPVMHTDELRALTFFPNGDCQNT